jgi:hypothetical protein
MTVPRQWDTLIGLTATDVTGDKVGHVSRIYLDESTGKPEWITVTTGMFGMRGSFAPLHGSSVRSDQLVLAVSKQLVLDAPNIDDDGHLDDAESAALYQHYASYRGPAAEDRGEGADLGGYQKRHARDTGAEHELELHAERPVVSKETVPVERARLATESVADEEQVSEEVRKERMDEPEVDTRPREDR